MRVTVLVLFLTLNSLSLAFYLPGLAPVTYCDNEKDDKCQVSQSL
jgi:hypothetical protein